MSRKFTLIIGLFQAVHHLFLRIVQYLWLVSGVRNNEETVFVVKARLFGNDEN